jgi:phosphatidylglycerophosphatase A
MDLRNKFILFAATGARAGYFPLFPGTIGTLVAIPISIFLNRLASVAIWPALLALVLAVFCAISIATRASQILRQKDPGLIVIDEVVGFMVANFHAPERATPIILSFILFRFFDIAKFYPTGRLERLPNGSGIVLDDIMAGVYTFAIIQLALTLELL